MAAQPSCAALCCCSTALGEYLASGTPVVVTRVGEVEDYVTDGEIAFVANRGAALAWRESPLIW